MHEVGTAVLGAEFRGIDHNAEAAVLPRLEGRQELLQQAADVRRQTSTCADARRLPARWLAAPSVISRLSSAASSDTLASAKLNASAFTAVGSSRPSSVIVMRTG